MVEMPHHVRVEGQQYLHTKVKGHTKAEGHTQVDTKVDTTVARAG